jgi:photosystem II protein
MFIEIQIFSEEKEKRFPIIKLTKSLNGNTGTATFLFLKPYAFEKFENKILAIESISLLRNNKKIESKDIQILFKNGKPIVLKVIFLFKNMTEWFEFLQFMNHYSKEKGFIFEPDIF